MTVIQLVDLRAEQMKPCEGVIRNTCHIQQIHQPNLYVTLAILFQHTQIQLGFEMDMSLRTFFRRTDGK